MFYWVSLFSSVHRHGAGISLCIFLAYDPSVVLMDFLIYELNDKA